MFSVALRLARRYISRRLLQSILFVVGVSLGVAMVIAIDLANSSTSRAFALSAETIAGRATHQIVGGPAGLPNDLYRQLRIELGLQQVAPVVTDYVRAVSLGDQPFRLVGVDVFADAPFRSYLADIQVAGENGDDLNALTAFLAEPNTIVISQSLADRFHIALGDTLTLRPGSDYLEVRVVGVLQVSDRASAEALDNLLLTDIATAQDLVGQPGVISRIDLILPADYDLSRLESVLPDGAMLTTPQQENSALAQMTDAFELNLQALSLLALVVGAFLIYNTVTFSVVQRRPHIGVLRALGATRPQIFTLILGEAFLLGLIGTVLGLGLGVLLGRSAVSLVAQTISDLYFAINVQSVELTPNTLLKGAAVGLLTSILTATIPSYEATRTPPAGTLRRSDVEQTARRLVPVMTGLAILMNGFGLMLLRLPVQSIPIAFSALFFIVLGGACFAPLLLVVGMRAATPITAAVFGVLGRMAARAVVRSLSRTSVAVAALTVSVSVIVGVSVMISSFRNTVSDWLETTLGADVYVSPPLGSIEGASVDVDPALANLLADVGGVAHVQTVRAVDVIAPDYPDLPPVNLAAPSADIGSRPRRFAWNLAPDGDYWAALEAGQVVVTESFAYRRGITPEHNQITLLTDRGPRAFTVVGVYYDYATDQGVMLMAERVYRSLFDDPFLTSLALFVEPGVDVDTVVDKLQTETLVGYDLQVQSYQELRAGVFEVFERAFTITIALQMLATLVAFIGILSALMALQLEHTRQYGVMRAVGMTPRELWRFTLIQTGLMGTAAGTLALPIGLVLSLVLIYVINVRSFGWTMQLMLRPDEFVGAFAVAVVAALVAGIYPAWRLSKLVTAQALRHE